ncbi:hypothetical protein PRIPAC_86039 [Pristionchus pacificus]|uniref:Innexin n=1 Tax=Pristionchus pacificus TaxID=54126 RepID=A0A2A6BV17_PRIPA|nr:hypothetical protein PRIPAC_86039 [Pristionchus pacificus]|eukprot:PDM69749.1 Innexin [Pristionchus pacificus]
MSSWLLRPHSLSDGIHRLNHLTTALMLLVFCVIVSAEHRATFLRNDQEINMFRYFGSPVECWTPSEYKGMYLNIAPPPLSLATRYVESYCLGSNTYTLSAEDVTVVGEDAFTEQEVNPPAFPQVALCDVSIRTIAGINKHTVQCTLSIYELNEAIYRFLMFWFVTVLSVSIVNLIYSAYQICIPSARVQSCKRWLSTAFISVQIPTKIRDTLVMARLRDLHIDSVVGVRFS